MKILSTLYKLWAISVAAYSASSQSKGEVFRNQDAFSCVALQAGHPLVRSVIPQDDYYTGRYAASEYRASWLLSQLTVTHDEYGDAIVTATDGSMPPYYVMYEDTLFGRTGKDTDTTPSGFKKIKDNAPTLLCTSAFTFFKKTVGEMKDLACSTLGYNAEQCADLNDPVKNDDNSDQLDEADMVTESRTVFGN